MNIPLKIIKINILSLVAIPFLLISAITKIVVTIVENLLLIIGIAVLTLVTAFVFEFLRNPGTILRFLIFIAIFIVIAAIFIYIMSIIFTMLVGIFSMITSFLLQVLEFISDITATIYGKIVSICSYDYNIIYKNYGSKIKSNSFCFCYTITYILNKLIIFILYNSIFIFILGAIVTFITPIILIASKINKDFGINLFSFLQLFHWYTLLYGIVIYIIALGGLSLIIVKLGIDVSKRIEEFKDLIDDYTEELSATIDVS
ncbi:hypothetical protein KQI30_02920 [Clostridium bornimense]|uniref:hypothetical protein n=1 Tax=Clostridium bornimense TaxID=1216932 RepID=UPI001C0FB81B|nr:hypothetical protein [Clostridium bornimense]MBU5315229.1 hypothetical protein [Clostridium bornimense]